MDAPEFPELPTEDTAVMIAGLRGEDAAARLIEVHARGPDDAVSALRKLEGHKASGPWSMRLPPAGTVDRLWTVSPGQCALHDHVAAQGLGEELRMLVSDGDRLVGWVSWWTRSPLSRRQRDAVNGCLPQVTESVRAWARGGLHRTGRRWNVLFDANGHFDNASPGARSWLTPREADELAAWVRDVHAGAAPPDAVVRGLPAEALLLEGDPVRYLVQVLVPGRPRLDPLWPLPERQRQVLELASVGATAPEIGRHLGIAAETVKRHLKLAYASLGVGSRVEIARLRWE